MPRKRYKAKDIVSKLRQVDVLVAQGTKVPDTPRRKSLMQTIDRLNADHGRVVRFASTGTKQEWKLRCDQRSPRYTTDWNELLRVA